MKWKYRAVGDAGVPVDGWVNAETEEEARVRLDRQGMDILDLKQDPIEAIKDRLFPSLVSGKDLQRFIEDLGDMLESGFKVNEALAMVDPATYGSVLRRGIQNAIPAIRTYVNQGMQLSDALEMTGQFQGDVIAIVRTGEETGRLGPILRKYSEIMEGNVSFQSEIALEMIYPVMVILMVMVAGAVYFGYVIPAIREPLSYVQLPLISRVVFGLADFLKWGWWLVLLGMAVGYAGWRWLVRHPAFGLRYRVPVFGSVRQAALMASVAFQLAACSGAGLGLAIGFGLLADTIKDKFVNKKMRLVSDKISGGLDPGEAVRDDDFFGKTFTTMLGKGILTNRVEEMLARAGKMLQKEAKGRMAAFIKILPAMTIFGLAIGVAILYLAIFLPITQLGEGINKAATGGR